MTTEIKCANCPTVVQRVFGPNDDAAAPWLCPKCDTDEGEVPIEDGRETFGSEEQLREADVFNGEPADIPYIGHLKAEGLLGDFPDDDPKPKPRPVLVDDGEWFEEHAGLPTKAEIAFTEKRLAKHGLSENIIHSQQDIQPVIVPVIEGTEFQGDIQRQQFDREVAGASWMVDARDEVDGDDMSSYHPVRTREHERFVPLWVLDDEKLRQVILKTFPKQATDAQQRESAGRLLRIVYLYFRANQWVKTIAGAVGCSVRAVEGVIRRARKVGAEMFGSGRAGSAVDSLREDYWCCCALKAA
jgi:hypothetical protein